MTVKELREHLTRYDDGDLVIMSKDAEGNSHSPLSDMWDGMYRAETTWYGEVGLRRLTPDYVAMGYGEEDVLTDGQKACILTPIN